MTNMINKLKLRLKETTDEVSQLKEKEEKEKEEEDDGIANELAVLRAAYDQARERKKLLGWNGLASLVPTRGLINVAEVPEVQLVSRRFDHIFS